MAWIYLHRVYQVAVTKYSLSVVCLLGSGISPPSPSQRRLPLSARLSSCEQPGITRPAWHPAAEPGITRPSCHPAQRSLLQQNVENKLRQLEQLQYDLTKQVALGPCRVLCQLLFWLNSDSAVADGTMQCVPSGLCICVGPRTRVFDGGSISLHWKVHFLGSVLPTENHCKA